MDTLFSKKVENFFAQKSRLLRLRNRRGWKISFFFSIKSSQKVLHAQGFRQAHRYYPADEICPRSERQVPAVSTASPWNQRNSFWISVSSATEYPSFWQMDSICLFGIPVFGLFEFKISDIWQQLGYRTKLRTTGLMALRFTASGTACDTVSHKSPSLREAPHAFPLPRCRFRSAQGSSRHS